MEARRSELPEHATGIAQVIVSLCGTRLLSTLLHVYEHGESGEAVITFVGDTNNLSLPLRNVTTDLGRLETVLGLPIPNAERPKLWIGLHEAWKLSKRKVIFKDCGIRVYIGAADEDSRQFLRLEWVAPEINKEGLTVYQGAHAGHPHWHIDRAALVGPEEHLRSLEILTAPTAEELPIEQFAGEETSPAIPLLVQDLSWFQSVHLPAQCGWMHRTWNGIDLPGPQQSEPENLLMLSQWWEGSLRYLFAELSKQAVV